MIFEILIVVVVVLLLYTLLQYITHVGKLGRYPPGPFPLPVIGNLHQVGPNAHETFGTMAKEFGDVFSISLGMERVVIVNSIQPAREALVTKGVDFAGRPNSSYTMGLLTRGYRDIAFLDYGPLWTFLRKLTHSGMKMYGEEFENLEGRIVKESEELHCRIKRANGKPIDVHKEFGCFVINIICGMVFGSRYCVDDKNFSEVLRWCNLIFESFTNGDAISFLPWLRYFPLENVKKLREAIALRDIFMRRKLKEHREIFDPNNIRDFTDCLIKSSMDKDAWNQVGVSEITDDHLEMILFDLFSAGGETTTTTLRWIVLYLLHWPHIQDELYEEIVKEIGTDRYPQMKDRPKLPLCQATIQETLRLSSLAPLALPHKAIKTSVLGGMVIPKDTQILFNLWSINQDTREWDDPENFNPHRWLDEKGRYISGKHKSFLPFGAGRRVCLGESLAKSELFVCFTRFIKDFRMEANPDQPFPSLKGRVGITLSPQPFNAIFIPRGRETSVY